MMEGHGRKPAIPEVVERFAAYRELPGNGVWGSLHCVLEDRNVRDADVEAAIAWAGERGDAEGQALGGILMAMSRTQRNLVSEKVDRFLKAKNEAPDPSGP